MRRLKISTTLLLILLAVVSLISFIYDLLNYYSYFTIQSSAYAHEFLTVSGVILFYLFLRTRRFYTETDVRQNLILFLKLLGILYGFVLIAKQFLSPSFSINTFPQEPESMFSLIYANLVSLAAVLLITPMLIIIKNLILYKRKKRTQLYLLCALCSIILCMLLTVILKTPLNLRPSGDGVYNNLAFIIALGFLALLATRNNWITYLSRKEKYYYFLISLALIWAILYIFDFAFAAAVPSHSLALGVYTNTAWLFLVFYTILAGLNLMLNLPTARVFDRKMKEVSSLHNLSRVISMEFNLEKLFRMITDMSSEVIEAELTWLEMSTMPDSPVKVVSIKNDLREEIANPETPPVQAYSDLILKQKKTLVIKDLPKDKTFDGSKEWRKHIGSMAGVPLISANGHIFGILFAAKTSTFGFDPDDVNMLEAYANQAAIAIENADLLKQSLARERMEKELQIARDVQNRLLPQDTPKLRHLQIDALTISAYEVGGDYHDFYYKDSSDLGIFIGDVSGKGASAAFYMAETKGIIQSLARTHQSPKEILIQTNKILYESMERKSFISILAARINLDTFRVNYARAGHCPVIYYNAATGIVHSLRPDGIAVGLDAGAIFDQTLQEETLYLQQNDILAFYTDGLSEARNSRDEEFGENRFCEYIQRHASYEVVDLKQKIIDEILGFLDGHNLHDDLTLILIKRSNGKITGGLDERI
jgi:serine phosphatase RsbU (regulator of sigma subunit)